MVTRRMIQPSPSTQSLRRDFWQPGSSSADFATDPVASSAATSAVRVVPAWRLSAGAARGEASGVATSTTAPVTQLPQENPATAGVIAPQAAPYSPGLSHC